jgi:hypothetical protein
MAGEGRYFESKEMFEAASMEYGKLATRFPQSPVPHEALGRCFFALKQYDRALSEFDAAAGKYNAMRMAPPPVIFENMIHITVGVKGDVEEGTKIAVAYARVHMTVPSAHLRLAALHKRIGKSPALAHAHARFAAAVSGGDPEVVEEAQAHPEVPLGLADLFVMDALG